MDYTREFVKGQTKGEDVRAFQQNLLTLGYELPKYGADGAYGTETETAAKECCKDQHWDYCSWGPCPIWCQQQVEEAAQAVPPTAFLPTGRGMWIQSLNGMTAPTVETIVKAVGIKFVIIQAHWQYTSQGSTTYNWPAPFGGLKQSYGCTANALVVLDKFRDLGVQLIPFSYPVPGKHEEVIDILGKYKEVWASPTVVIDPEQEWKGHATEAKDLATKMAAAFPSWGMTSYGAPWYHRSFPYAEFSSATYGLPQTYGVTTFGDEGFSRAWSEWQKYGFKNLVGLYGTYDKSDSQMRQLLTTCAAMKPTATAGWKWETTEDSEWDHIANILPK